MIDNFTSIAIKSQYDVITQDFNFTQKTEYYVLTGLLGVTILDTIDTILSGVGFLFNTTAFTVFMMNGKAFGFPIKYLLIHQSLLDMMACLIGFIIHLQPSFWHVSNYYWEVINCYLWHSQYFFWYFLHTSANNLVYLAYDRYRAVVHPLHYKDISKCQVYLGFALTHIYSIAVRWPVLFWVSMEGGVCVGGWAIKGKYATLTSNIYGVFEFFVHYAAHTIALIIIYGKVIKESRKVLKAQNDTTSLATQKSLSVVTKAAIAVTVVYILTFSWIQWNYTPGVLVGWFKLGTTIQKTNVIAGTINSSCNPIFYCLYMPSFRHALLKTFLPWVNINATPAKRSETNNIEMTSAPKSQK